MSGLLKGEGHNSAAGDGQGYTPLNVGPSFEIAFEALTSKQRLTPEYARVLGESGLPWARIKSHYYKQRASTNKAAKELDSLYSDWEVGDTTRIHTARHRIEKLLDKPDGMTTAEVSATALLAKVDGEWGKEEAEKGPQMTDQEAIARLDALLTEPGIRAQLKNIACPNCKCDDCKAARVAT